MEPKNKINYVFPGFGISVKIFREWLDKMPPDAEITNAGYDIHNDCAMMQFTSKEFPPTGGFLHKPALEVNQNYNHETGETELIMPEIPKAQEAD